MNRGRENIAHVFLCHMDLLERGVWAFFPNIKINFGGERKFEEAGRTVDEFPQTLVRP
jgi:hypothetical protein